MSDKPNNWLKSQDWLAQCFILMGIALAILTIGLTIYELIPFLSTLPETPAERGIMFAGLSALVSGLAFAGLIFTLRLQMQATRRQGEELQESRREMIAQRKELESQNRTFVLQTFDSVFFQMVALHNQIVSELSLHTDDGTKHGRDCFHFYYSNFLETLESAKKTEGDSFEVVHNVCDKFFLHLASDLGHYFRNLSTTIKLVDQSDVHNKRRYTNILRAQLSGSELALLFYNCLATGRDEFKQFVEHYSLIKNLPTELLDEEAHTEWYDARAYASSAELEDLKA